MQCDGSYSFSIGTTVMRIFILIIFTVSVWANDQIPGTEQKRPILLKGGILHTVSGDVLEGYDILFAKGKVISIEKSIMASPETDVYDIYDKHVVPGYIAPFTQLGLVGQQLAQIQPGAFPTQTVGYAPPAAPASPMSQFLTGATGAAGIMGKLGLFG